MSKVASVGHPPFGFEPHRSIIRATARLAVNAGDIVQIDVGQSDAAVDTFSVGRETGAFANVIAPTAAGVKSGIFAVALETLADNEAGQFLLSGLVQVSVIKGAGNVVAGDPLVAIASQDWLDAALAAGEKYVALALEALTAPTSATSCWVWFDGVDGFGTFVS